MVAAGSVTLVGMVLTTYGALTHVGQLLAPGSALILVGAGWLGNVLARREVRLFPASVRAEPQSGAEGR